MWKELFMKLDKKTKKEAFKFLDELKNVHKINMFGAGTYLRERFDLTKSESYDLLSEYMKGAD